MEKFSNGILKVERVCLSFGAVEVLREVSIDIKEREILAIVGPNGAGKTCLLNCINGFYNPQQGEIYYKGQKITRKPAYKRAALGIGRTFQNVEIYSGLTTLDNLMAGRHPLMKEGVISGALYFGKGRKIEIEHRRAVEKIIDLLEMEAIRDTPGSFLTYGQRKKVDLGRALALVPKLLLLDEPMAGMNLDEKEDIARYVLDVNQLWSIPIILVEHDMGVVMDIADRVVVLDFGEKIAEGTPEEIKTDPKVIKAYLGGVVKNS